MSWMLAVRFVARIAVDLVVAEFLGGTEDSETGVADQNIDAPEIGDGAFDDGPQGGGVADVEHLDPEQVGVTSR